MSCHSQDLKIKADTFIEILDERVLNLIDPTEGFEILAEAFSWTEGPLWMEREQALIFSDIPQNSIFKIDNKGALTLYLKPSGYTKSAERGGETGSNALILDKEGNLVLCQHGDRRMARMSSSLDDPKPNFETIVDNYEGKRLNSPNDAVYDRQGNLYFTDPPYGLEFGMEDPTKELTFHGVFQLKTDGSLLLLDSLSRPNGIAWSPDEKYLYVANSDPNEAVWYRYERSEDGFIHNRTVFLDATEFVGKSGFQGLPDGLKVHSSGVLFATGPGGVWVFDSDGIVLARLRTGEATSNCALSTDEKTLYLTANSFILKLNLK
ncbi:SMP-30/gluconolactonase/LRE family protein [Mongoliitalea daihaiensis]|uniref:SMP-30/gluconolactonase/LRE family protein n=1 Tax=Mongoliitalea daihaiensis TaxID=2782006 RepID=UPI001F3BB83B|nr:SMP-30/gluconolactonase/LRE family protein [Mongoliitalea daihaiensis]